MNLIVHYLAGSGGDMFVYPLITSGHWNSPIKNHTINDAGRMFATMDPRFVDRFGSQPGIHFYSRDWGQDHGRLADLEPWLLLITDPAQAVFMKQQYPDSYLISIEYSHESFVFVLDSFCRKVLDHPDHLATPAGTRFLDAVAKTPEDRERYIEYGKQGILGDWYREQRFSNMLTFPPESHSLPSRDYLVKVRQLWYWTEMDRMYREIESNLGLKIDTDLFRPIHQRWLQLQRKFDQ